MIPLEIANVWWIRVWRW